MHLSHTHTLKKPHGPPPPAALANCGCAKSILIINTRNPREVLKMPVSLIAGGTFPLLAARIP